MAEPTFWGVGEARKILNKVRKISINALRDGIYKDLIYRLIQLGNLYDGGNGDQFDTSLFDYYLDVMEQTLLPGQSENSLKKVITSFMLNLNVMVFLQKKLNLKVFFLKSC